MNNKTSFIVVQRLTLEAKVFYNEINISLSMSFYFLANRIDKNKNRNKIHYKN